MCQLLQAQHGVTPGNTKKYIYVLFLFTSVSIEIRKVYQKIYFSYFYRNTGKEKQNIYFFWCFLGLHHAVPAVTGTLLVLVCHWTCQLCLKLLYAHLTDCTDSIPRRSYLFKPHNHDEPLQVHGVYSVTPNSRWITTS